MKFNILDTVLVAVPAVLMSLYSCSGNIDTSETGLVLVPDKTEIMADGQDAVTFKVMDGDADVTADASVISVSDGSVLENAVFTASSAGTYGFYAEYGGNTSETVEIVATGEVSAYKRNYCIIEFTAQHCTFCPDGSDRLLGYFIPEVMRGETAEVLAFHSNSMGEDIFYIEGTEEMREHFGSQNLPSFVFDMREAGDFSILRPAFETSREEYPAHCGLALSSVLSQDALSAEVTVSLASSVASSYRVALFVVEDRVTASQDTPTGPDAEYLHRHVVRSVESSTWQGDNFGDLAAGQEVSRTYSVRLDPSWNVEETSVCAVAYDAEGYANNCISCTIDGGKADYQTNE